jgi:hypothetical protein
LGDTEIVEADEGVPGGGEVGLPAAKTLLLVGDEP